VIAWRILDIHKPGDVRIHKGCAWQAGMRKYAIRFSWIWFTFALLEELKGVFFPVRATTSQTPVRLRQLRIPLM